MRGDVTLTLVPSKDTIRIVEIEAGDTTLSRPGIAVDIGTTTVALELVDLGTGDVISRAVAYNRQMKRGLDNRSG